MGTAPFAPWMLGGEAIVGLARWRGGPRVPLPDGIARMPGPCLVVAARDADSPVGPYLELAVGEPAWLGLRPGWCITTMVVDSQQARVGGVLNWGFPREMGKLRWHGDADCRELVWEERGLVVRGRGRGPSVPLVAPLRSLQHRSDGRVVVPGRLRALGRLARVTVQTFPGDDLAGLAGDHTGAVVAGMRFVVHPARHPAGLTATLRAPLRAPEPALSSDER